VAAFKPEASGSPWIKIGFLACGALLMVGSLLRLVIS